MGWHLPPEKLRADEREARAQLKSARTKKERLVAGRRLGAVIIELGNQGLAPLDDPEECR